MPTRVDYVIFCVAIVSIIWLFFALWQPAIAGEWALLQINGKTIEKINLHHDGHILAHGLLGDSVLEVRNGKIRFVTSPCNGKQCIHMGWVQRSGEFIACLPNRVAITIEGGEAVYDAVNF